MDREDKVKEIMKKHKPMKIGGEIYTDDCFEGSQVRQMIREALEFKLR